MTAPQAAGGWRGHLFGLGIEAGFALAGCRAGEIGDGLPHVDIAFADGAALCAAVDAKASAVIARIQDGAGRWIEHVRAHPETGYLLTSPGHGIFHIDSVGERVLAAPASVPPWLWQRALVGEVLPFVSALRGRETLHASAVVVGNGAATIAIVGSSGAGKTSLAADMVLRGATLLADDVVALTCDGGVVVAHPGPGLMSLRTITSNRLGMDAVRRLGATVGSDARGIRVAVPRSDSPIPLAALYRLTPAADARLRLDAVLAPDPQLLLGCTFNLALRTPARLTTQLDVCSAIAATVRVVRVHLPPDVDHEELASTLLADAERSLAAAGTGI